MALIKCPECGRKNVSDIAEACPNCGYNIRVHLEEEKRKIKIEKWNEELEKMRQDELKKRMEKIEMPKPAKISKGLIIYSLVSIIWWWYVFIYFPVKSHENPQILFCIVLLCVVVGIPIYIHYGNHKKAKEDYELACRSFEKYQKKAIEEQDRFWESFDEMFGDKTGICCPVCNSSKIKRISTVNRAVSVGAVGLASSKIGKQYECKSCHHKW